MNTYLDKLNGLIFVWSATLFMGGLIFISFTGANIIWYFLVPTKLLISLGLTFILVVCIFVSHELVIDCLVKENNDSVSMDV
jgi:hypothetical protein